MEPPDELRRKLQLSKDQVCALVGNAYGRVDAPLLFYKELSKQLKTLKFRTHPLEPCVFILESGEGSQRKLHGALGVHVDDGVGGGDEYFHQQISSTFQSSFHSAVSKLESLCLPVLNLNNFQTAVSVPLKLIMFIASCPSILVNPVENRLPVR